jgi:methanogenic corrinoid protein MtbC1
MENYDLGSSLLHDGLYKKAVKEMGTLREKLPEEAFAALAREVIRRLSDHSAAPQGSISFPSDETIDELARALMQPGLDAGKDFIDRIREQGASVETVYLAYLAEAAKKLGEWWEEDEVSFVDVTLGTGHIYAIMRGLKPLFRAPLANLTQPHAFFAAVPGETHLLGVSMAADLFRKNGWEIDLKRDLDHDMIIHHTKTSGVPLIGLSASGDHALVPLARLVIALRISAPDASIMVSGAILASSYEGVKEMGIDIIPSSMDDALTKARGQWDLTVQQAKVRSAR